MGINDLNWLDCLCAVKRAFPDLRFQTENFHGQVHIVAKHPRFILRFGIYECEDWQDRTKQKKYVSASAETVNRYSGMSSPNDSYEEAIESTKPFLERECGYKPPKPTVKQLSFFEVCDP